MPIGSWDLPRCLASTTTRELADLVPSAAGIDPVEHWTPEALLSELGTISQPPRVNVHSDVDGGLAINEWVAQPGP